MKRILIVTMSLFIQIGIFNSAQAQTKTAAVLNIYSNIESITPETAGSLLRIELEKTGFYRVLDKHDILEIGKEKEIDLTSCYGKKCLSEVGSSIGVDQMFSGSIEKLGNKIVISLKSLNTTTQEYELTTIQEYLNIPHEIQTMLELTLNKMLSIENNQEIFKTLAYYAAPPETLNTNITNNGPRVGVAFVGGDLGQRLMDPESEGGWDAIPVVSQFGYQLEKEYLSAGNFHALIEGLFVISGPEQQLFNPKLVIMNGFRSSNSGLEFAFGPSFGIEKSAQSYIDSETNQWHLASDWTQADSLGNILPNPNPIVSRIDNRGDIKLTAGWVVGVGKTFNSGHLNIPVNLFASFSKHGWQSGISIGFNLRQR
jgi:hypothetical protein